MQQHTVHAHPGSKKSKKRVGRGDSSGHGSFSTRGVKGQNSRTGGGVRTSFEGGQTPLVRRIPKFRGFKNPTRVPFQVINLSDLNRFNDGDTIDTEVLRKLKIIKDKGIPVKVLGDGELTKKLTVKVDACSKSAKEKIEKKGGVVYC